ncbi:MAG: T9SS type A sorting domain-containing protein [Bacteroidetes bacterium]|nr:T9SS type A sorting domain-containing protein [Bacteroidota bacterium]
MYQNGNSVDVSHLSMGIYFLEIMIDNVKYATKFIKQ